jgi:hypothetical protein
MAWRTRDEVEATLFIASVTIRSQKRFPLSGVWSTSQTHNDRPQLAWRDPEVKM